MTDAEPPSPESSSIAAWTVFRPVATLMVVVAVAVFGYISYRQLPVSLMPELSYPTLTVRTELVGAAPQEVEENITRPLEEIIRTVEGVVGLESTSRAGQSDVVLRFVWNTDMDYAMQKVRERVELVPLPEQAETPLILRYDPALDPIMRLGLSGDADLTDLRRLAEDEVQRSLEKIDGLAMIRVRGGEEEVVRADLDPGRMAFLGVTTVEVAGRLEQENVNLAGGALSEGDITYLVRTLNAFQTIEEIERLIVAYPGGIPVRLEQIARVYKDVRDPEVVTRMGGPDGVSDSVVIEVFKEADANLVDVSERVRHVLYGSADSLRGRARSLAEDRAGRVADQALIVAQGGGGVTFGRPIARSNIIAADLPVGVRVDVLSDQAIFIQESIDEVRNTALWGGLFAILVLVLFLRNFWSTVIIAIAIPLSVISAFGALRLAGVSLNVMSLGGIALGVGMLVDNSIVVLESIFRCQEEGDPPVQAALRGTHEVAGAVVASTLTTIAVFFPIVFVEGIAGQIFGDLALSVVFALLASLATAVFFVPMLASRPPVGVVDLRTAVGLMALRRRLVAPDSFVADVRGWLGASKASKGWARWLLFLLTPIVVAFLLVRVLLMTVLEVMFARIGVAILGLVLGLILGVLWVVKILAGFVARLLFSAFDVGWNRVTLAYPPALRFALRAPFAVLVVAVGGFIWSGWQFQRLGTELLPAMHQGEFTLHVGMPVGTRLEDTARSVRRVEQALVEIDGVRRFATTVGVERTEVQATDEGEHTARITVSVKGSDDPEGTERQVMSAVRSAAAELAGATSEIDRPALFTLQTPLEVRVFSDDLRLLRQSSDLVEARLRKVETLADVRNDLGRGFPEVQVIFDRDRLAAFGMSALQVGEGIRDQVRGLEPTKIQEDDNTLSIVVRTNPAEIPSVESLGNLIVRARTDDAPEIRLSGVAALRLAEGPSEIRHVEGRRAAVVEADVPLASLSGAAAEVKRALRTLGLPGSVVATVSGQNVEMERAIDSLLFALMLAIFLVYIVLASKFESFRGPLVILLSIPLALVGVVLTLTVLDLHVSVLVFIGLIMLAGIVVNNAIVLVDYINQLRERGKSLEDAIVSASEIRLRPVLITTLTTILGLLPMALGIGAGAELRQPMGITVIAGLASATLLTLFVVPVLYRVLMRGGVASPSDD